MIGNSSNKMDKEAVKDVILYNRPISQRPKKVLGKE
jgi:hypothetical protein